MPRKRSPSPWSTSSASTKRAEAAGWRRERFHATFISSNTTRDGACSRWPSISSITASAPGSANAIAASADASTTLSGIAHLADDVRGALARGEVQLPDPVEHLARGDRGHFVRRALDQIEQLALQRSAVAHRAGAQPFDYFVRHVFDGETGGHGSNMVLYRNHVVNRSRGRDMSTRRSRRPRR